MGLLEGCPFLTLPSPEGPVRQGYVEDLLPRASEGLDGHPAAWQPGSGHWKMRIRPVSACTSSEVMQCPDLSRRFHAQPLKGVVLKFINGVSNCSFHYHLATEYVKVSWVVTFGSLNIFIKHLLFDLHFALKLTFVNVPKLVIIVTFCSYKTLSSIPRRSPSLTTTQASC
jgi:hypothetical protein